MGPLTKSALLELAEESVKVVLAQTVKVLEAAAADSGKIGMTTVASGAKMVNDGFLQSLAEKINPAD